jgi:hypothetical protein
LGARRGRGDLWVDPTAAGNSAHGGGRGYRQQQQHDYNAQQHHQFPPGMMRNDGAGDGLLPVPPIFVNCWRPDGAGNVPSNQGQNNNNNNIVNNNEGEEEGKGEHQGDQQ